MAEEQALNSYQKFAQIYDMFMDNVEYETWQTKILALLAQRGVTEGIVCDLACGTGNMTELMAKEGFDMIGIDASERMLQTAIEKRDRSGLDILYLNQDMREFELYGTVAAVISVCDSVNYITETEELAEVFRLVHMYLDPGGAFIFDFNTPAAYERIQDETIAENREEGSFIWENAYEPESRINQMDLTLFIRAENGYFERFEETHIQRAYMKEEILMLLREAGFTGIETCEEYSDRKDTDSSCRITVACVKE